MDAKTNDTVMTTNVLAGYRHDPELVKRCLDGDESAWRTLVNRYARLVYSIPRRYGFSTEDADDVFQNVFTIAFQQLSHLRNQTLLAAWLITITQRQCQRIRKSTRPTAELAESIADPQMSTADQAKTWELQHLVREAILQLEPECRQLVTSLFLDPESPSYQEISASLDIPVGSIGPNRARCLKRLEMILTAMDVDLD